MSVPSLQSMSAEEYLRTEELSPFKREYVGGFVYPLHGGTRAQAGTTAGHVRIARNIVVALDTQARKLGCDVFASDMKLRAEATDNFYYPDVMVVCGPHLPDSSAVFVTSPCLLIEITSKSTARNDRLAKHAAYTAVASVQTYLIVEQGMRRVYVYQRQGERWASSDLAGQGQIALPCLGTELSLDQMYAGLTF